MTNEQILKKAIEKAVKNGYKGIAKGCEILGERILITAVDSNTAVDFTVSIPEIIFSHDFAKAFWGEEEIEVDRIYSTYHGEPSDGSRGSFREGDTVYRPIYKISWKHHLQQIVLEEYPIKYLKQFL